MRCEVKPRQCLLFVKVELFDGGENGCWDPRRTLDGPPVGRVRKLHEVANAPSLPSREEKKEIVLDVFW